MLRKISSVSEKSGATERVWFSGETMDLFVWTKDNDDVTSFQLSYDKPNVEKSLVWDHESGKIHAIVDTGSNPGKHPSAPVLQEEQPYDKSLILSMLNECRGELSEQHFEFIQSVILS